MHWVLGHFFTAWRHCCLEMFVFSLTYFVKIAWSIAEEEENVFNFFTSVLIRFRRKFIVCVLGQQRFQIVHKWKWHNWLDNFFFNVLVLSKEKINGYWFSNHLFISDNKKVISTMRLALFLQLFSDDLYPWVLRHSLKPFGSCRKGGY